MPPALAKAVGAEVIKALNVYPIKPNITYKAGDSKLLNVSKKEAIRFLN